MELVDLGGTSCLTLVCIRRRFVGCQDRVVMHHCAVSLRGTRHHRGVGIPRIRGLWRRGRSRLAASPPLRRDLGERKGGCAFPVALVIGRR